MRNTVVMCDGTVGSLIAAASAGLRVATGPTGQRAYAYLYGPSEYHLKAAAQQAYEFGLERLPEHVPICESGAEGIWVEGLLDAGMRVGELGGGELIWPVAMGDGNQPDLNGASRALSASLLVSQLVAVARADAAQGGGGEVKVEAPYADLTRRQLVDIALDMDLPIWLSWWMEASTAGPLYELANAERAKWSSLMREAGWLGSLESKVVVRPEALSRFTGQTHHGVAE